MVWKFYHPRFTAQVLNHISREVENAHGFIKRGYRHVRSCMWQIRLPQQGHQRSLDAN